jgi:hypothetical protein
MDTTEFRQELQQAIPNFGHDVASFAVQVQTAACFELRLPDPGATLAIIATLIDAGLALPDTLEPRKCERCGMWHARRIGR